MIKSISLIGHNRISYLRFSIYILFGVLMATQEPLRGPLGLWPFPILNLIIQKLSQQSFAHVRQIPRPIMEEHHLRPGKIDTNYWRNVIY